MKHYWVRPTRLPEEQEQVAEWMQRICDINLLDPNAISYKSNEFYTVDKGSSPVLHTFVQNVYMWDVLAPSPEATELDEAHALYSMAQALVLKAREKGYGEIWFPCEDERVVSFCQKHGFEEVKMRMFRLKLNRLP